MIDLLFLAHNRLEFTRASAESAIENTDWAQVQAVYSFDDASIDGTHEYLANLKWPVRSIHNRSRFGGPVDVMNCFIRNVKPDLFAKIDNDVLLPPGWLGECLGVMDASPHLALLGIECGDDFPVGDHVERRYERAHHIGGIGLMRGKAFEKFGLPRADGRMGFTHWQEKNEVVAGWLRPNLPVALLDHLPMEPWKSLSEEYIAKGWQRHGWNGSNFYELRSHRLWDWWAGAKQGVAVAG